MIVFWQWESQKPYLLYDEFIYLFGINLRRLIEIEVLLTIKFLVLELWCLQKLRFRGALNYMFVCYLFCIVRFYVLFCFVLCFDLCLFYFCFVIYWRGIKKQKIRFSIHLQTEHTKGAQKRIIVVSIIVLMTWSTYCEDKIGTFRTTNRYKRIQEQSKFKFGDHIQNKINYG